MGKSMGVKETKAPNTAQSSQRKAITKMIIGMFVLVGLITLITNFKQKEVVVTRAKTTLMAGDVITADMLEGYPMLNRVYTELGTKQIMKEDGSTVTANAYIKFKDKDQLIGKKINSYVRAGDPIEVGDISTSNVDRNPWISGIGEDQEIYTMKFDPAAVNTRLLYPGTRIRARLVANIPNGKLEQLKAQIKATAQGEDGTVNSSILTNPSIAGAPVVTGSTVDAEGNIDYSTADLTGTTPLAEIVIDSITIADMRNAQGESIFDIYSGLVKLPIDKRLKYISSSLTSSEDSVSFQKRVTPVDVTFIVSREGANLLSEFENTKNAQIKYTILPGVAEDAPEACVQLLQQFQEVSNQIVSVADASGNTGTTTQPASK